MSYDYSPQPKLDGTVRRPDYQRKLVVVGDGGCGKTCLLTVYAEGRFPEEYVPTVFENSIVVRPSPLDPGKTVELSLWDTAGQEDFDRLRPLSYNDTNVVLVVFAINFRNSLLNVSDKWFPEINHFCPTTPILLIGTKIDLRTDASQLAQLAAQGTRPVSAQEGEALAREIGARAYMECSARTGQGVREIFDAAMRAALKTGGLVGSLGLKGEGRRRGKGCVVL